MKKNTHISYWLLPSKPFFKGLEKIIHDLSAEYKSPVFQPHLTVYSGPGDENSLPMRSQKILQNAGSIRLKIKKLSYRELYTKTFYIEFHEDSSLSEISHKLRTESPESDFQLHPHLSLLYKKIGEERQKELVSRIILPWKEITFNRYLVISNPPKIDSPDDIRAWKILS